MRVSARSVIPTTFQRHPDIKASYQRFKAQEARYDFFYVSRDTLTPRIRAVSSYEEDSFRNTTGRRVYDQVSRHTLEAGIEKRFFDTTRIEVGTGVDGSIDNSADGYQPFVFAELRYPLGGSRERLERTSEDIFRRNELDDAQLEYIDEVRDRLSNALEQFYEVIELDKRASGAEQWVSDLKQLDQLAAGIADRDTTNDRLRIQAELTDAAASVRNLRGRHEVELVRLKSAAGIDYLTEIEVDEVPFNPFLGKSHDEILALALETDPEIATLRNAASNAHVQFELAKKGKYDVVLTTGAETHALGGGTKDDEHSWSAFAGLELNFVDERVTSSLTGQALASILRFAQAIEARRREIYVSTFDPLIRIETLTTSRDELSENIERFRSDYQNGIDEYLDGSLNIDNLINRRRTLFSQEEEIAELTNAIGENVAELGAATGKFFEMLDQDTPAPPED